MKKTMLAILLALACLAGGLSPAKAEDNPAVVRVGEYSYSKSLVEFTIRSTADENGFVWEMLKREDKEQIRDAVLKEIIGIGVIECKLAERGRHDFTEEETEILRAKAQNIYEAMWQKIYQSLNDSGTDITEEEVSRWMNRAGYTQEMFLESTKASERQSRAFELYCGDVSVTDGQILEYYERTYVKPDRERYENNVRLFEEEILTKGNEAFFVPEGYKYIKLIRVDYPEELIRETQSMRLRLSITDEELIASFNVLAEAAATVAELEDLEPYREAYFICKKANEEAGNAYLDKLSEAMPLAEAVAENVKKGLAQGQSVEQMITQYSDDDTYADPKNPGTPFHTDSANWNGSMREAALQLHEIGDLSGPVAGLDGIYLLYYAGDMPGGAHTLTEDEFGLMKMNALYEARLSKLTDLIGEWQKAYEVICLPEVIDLD